MKKEIASKLNQVAEGMPIVFNWKEEPVEMTGEELLLTPVSDHQLIEKGKTYQIMVPCMVAVCHKHQLKDAYKRGGWPAVKEYHQSVIAKIKK